MKIKPKSVHVYRSNELLVVASVSNVEGGLRQQDGWTVVNPSQEFADTTVGELVKAGVERSGVVPVADLPVLPRGATVASEAAGFASEDAMRAAGAPSAAVGLRGSEWEVVPMVNMGPGKGWSGHKDAPEVIHEGEWSGEELGAVVLEALDAAERLSRV